MIPNLASAMQAAFSRTAMNDADRLRAMGGYAAHARVMEAGKRPHFTAFTVFVLGLP